MASECSLGEENDSNVTVVCVGETMLMFAPARHDLIEHSSHFAAATGGAESDVAIGLERLGVHAGWIGKLPRNCLGRRIVNEIRAYGVDTSAVIWTDSGRAGTFFVEWGARPRPLAVVYDRANSAASTLVTEDLDWDYIARTRWVQLSGITPALSESCRVSTREIAARAGALGVKVSFDVNYRSSLWSVDEARAALQGILPFVDLLTTSEADAAMLLGAKLGRREALQRLHDAHSCEAVVMTLGHEGSMAYDGEAFYASPGYPVESVNRLGAGDAFVAGLLFGYLKSDLQTGLNYGGAMAALKMTIRPNIPVINRRDVEQLLAGSELSVIR